MVQARWLNQDYVNVVSWHKSVQDALLDYRRRLRKNRANRPQRGSLQYRLDGRGDWLNAR